MTDKQLTDNEIIKALEYCEDSADTDKHCLKCPYCNESYCLDKMMADALSLINRQKAEIERLQKHIKEGIVLARQLPELASAIRAEAIKEFAERLKSVVAIHNGDMWSKYEYIDNLVKEMVGDNNE